MGCSGMALLVFVQHGQRDGYSMEVPKVAVVFLEKIFQGFVLERVLLPFYWVDNDTRDVDIGLGREYPFITAIATQLSNYITRVRDNILKSKEQKNIQPTKGGHKMVTCQNYVSLFYCQITSCPSDEGIS